jgi:hypothetical protein
MVEGCQRTLRVLPHPEMTTSTTIEPRGRTERRTGTHKAARRPNRLVPAGLYIALVGGLSALFFFISIRTSIPDSDGATAILEGQSMAAGHLVLHGWALSLDSFWTIDAAFNTVGVWLLGVKSTSLHLVPAFIAALVVLVGIVLARAGRRGAAGIAAAVPVFCILGLPNNYLSYFFLDAVAHVGTTLWCLVAFLALAWKPNRVKWLVGVAFLAAGLLGDLQMVGLGVVPVFLAGIVTVLRTRSWREGLPMTGAAIASVVLAGIVRGLALLVGTFTIGMVQASADTTQTLKNLRSVADGYVRMLGVQQHASGSLWAPEIGHFIGLVAVAAAILVFALRMIVGVFTGNSRAVQPSTDHPGEPGTDLPGERGTEAWRVDDLLLLACLGGMVVFIKLAGSNDFNLRRYLTAAVIFGAVLAGRLVGELVARIRSTRLIWAIVAVCLAIIGSVCVDTQSILANPVLSQPQTPLGNFLESHELTSGIGDYWSSSITTVVTDDKVRVRPVIANPSGKIVRYGRQSSASWYKGQSFQFLVYTTATPFGVDSEVAVGTFGSPEHTYHIGSYVVLVWSHPLLISPLGGYDPG